MVKQKKILEIPECAIHRASRPAKIKIPATEQKKIELAEVEKLIKLDISLIVELRSEISMQEVDMRLTGDYDYRKITLLRKELSKVMSNHNKLFWIKTKLNNHHKELPEEK